jgi:hypothetical protein
MSHQPSPGPSHHAHASAANSGRHKAQKHMAPSVLAGMEDAKYELKYRELKKKVKEIELVRPHRLTPSASPSRLTAALHRRPPG